jgi:hypothetical protein
MHYSELISYSTIIFLFDKKFISVLNKNTAVVVLEIVFIFTINQPYN